ncbi:putative transcription factor MYB-HB-like family [Helianthus annuus]|nr:putative transcription factor MYB-HB-like family [Helianthus annuus]
MAPKKWWTSKEEEALKAGVKEYKAGNWKDILKDPRFASILANRTNIDLKVVTCPAKFAKHASISDCGHLVSTEDSEAA